MFFVPRKSAFYYFLNLITTTAKQICGSFLGSGREQKSYTYHSFLPDDAHAILNAREPVGDLCEIVLAHGSLFDGEWTVVGRHDIQSVTVAEQSEMEG